MVWSFLKRTSVTTREPNRAYVSEGTRVYVVGDIHGCLALLDTLLNRIADDHARAPAASASIIFLGDYIDRGPDSRGVLERLARREVPLPYVALRGNHEEMLISFLSDAAYMSSWRHFGGLETLHSFGFDIQSMLARESFEEARVALIGALPQHVLDFLAHTRTHHELDHVYFCHAGVRPGIPLAQQASQDLMWIREEFLASSANHGKMIVHGHTPVETPDIRPNRINVDTGAYLTGTLTALVMESTGIRFIST